MLLNLETLGNGFVGSNLKSTLGIASTLATLSSLATLATCSLSRSSSLGLLGQEWVVDGIGISLGLGERNTRSKERIEGSSRV